jgi:5-methylcytosine-specific restriction endonuclease McrA
MVSKGWNRLWVPAYSCQTVVRAILETRISVEYYRSWFLGSRGDGVPFHATRGDDVLVVIHFGLKFHSRLETSLSDKMSIIEYRSHDPWSPWSFNSRADYCVASLRKTLPIPDGRVLWSPSKQDLLPKRPPLTHEHRLASKRKLDAMRLKRLFLNGQVNDRSRFRLLSSSGESHICGRDVSAISSWSATRLRQFPAKC